MSLLRQQYIVIIQCEAPAAEMVSMVRQRDMSLSSVYTVAPLLVLALF